METNKRKHIFLVVGRTGSGKSTLVRNACETFGMKQLVSYTTRGMRKGEQDRTDHVFIRPGDVEKYAEEMVAYTEIGGAEYFSTVSKLLESDFYTIDPAGVQSLYAKVSQTPALQDVEFHEIYVYTPEIDRKARLYIRDGEVNEMRLQSEEVQFAHYEKERTFDYKIWNIGSLAYAQRQFDAFVERYLIEDRTAVSWSYELFHDQNHVIARTDGYRSRVDALLAAQKYREERGWNDLTIRLFEVVKKAKGGKRNGR